ncbi:hypothetical protein Xen7305DRAFT_00044050 [Xenococcus sp. PCC 7305]|uniref:DUF6262 family protein n=1 Tax=Xenococcus sp. PCC 7305 TaxID=102125 RepID=UPI0002ABFFAF|nr:DUF6262 family protein [Xenococcus sp. PCC 7305]ELS04669.1 hypothetical protein Xen7305DRAFT_00044050 [Xenococcus sp. PCC 7305]
MTNKRIKALAKAAEKKKKAALAKTEKAIKDLIRQKQKITIRSVARTAGVSVSYIYKYPELAERIQDLREQQQFSPVQPKLPSGSSSQMMTTQLRDRIKTLEQEKQELSQEITIFTNSVSEMGKSDQLVDRLKAENIRLLEENQKLRKQLEDTEKKLIASREFILNQGYKNPPKTKAIQQA